MRRDRRDERETVVQGHTRRFSLQNKLRLPPLETRSALLPSYKPGAAQGTAQHGAAIHAPRAAGQARPSASPVGDFLETRSADL